MKKEYLICLLTVFSTVCFAQIKLVGIRSNDQNPTISIVKWDAFLPELQQEFSTTASTYLLGSSLMDDSTSDYYFRSEFQLNAFNTQNDEYYIVQDETNFNGATHIDMADGSIYAVFPEGQIPDAPDPDSPYFSFVKLNTTDNSIVRIGTITENVTALPFSEGTCYNSDTSDYYFLGYDQSFQLNMYKSTVTDVNFSYTKIALPVELTTYYLSGLYFDIQSNKIVAVKSVFDDDDQTNREIVQIDPVTGAFTTLYTFNNLVNLQNGSTTFDQDTRSYIAIIFDQNFDRKLFVYNTLTNSATETTIPVDVGEIQADNSSFAQLRYPNLGNESFDSNWVTVYPMPIKNYLNVETLSDGFNTLSIYGIDGKVYCKESYSTSKMNLNVSHLPSGFYMLQLENQSGISYKKLIKE